MILAQKEPGVVFCDRYVADGNYQNLLAAYPQSAKPRVAVTSRSADWEKSREAMRCGAFDIIPVPCRRTEVEWMVIQVKRAQDRAEGPGPRQHFTTALPPLQCSRNRAAPLPPRVSSESLA
jgi:DNA-binding NtrC family response regulator